MVDLAGLLEVKKLMKVVSLLLYGMRLVVLYLKWMIGFGEVGGDREVW